MTGRDGYYPPRVTVSAGTGTVWENPTRGIPVRNPSGPLIGPLRRPYICTNVFPRSSVPVPILLSRTPLTSRRRMLHFRSARRSCYVTWCPCWCGVPCRCSCVVCACGRSCRRRRCRCRGGKEETKRIRRGCSITLRWTTLATPDQLPNWVKWWLPAQLGADHHHGTFIKIWENEKSFLISWDSMYYKNEPNKCEENSEKYYTW